MIVFFNKKVNMFLYINLPYYYYCGHEIMDFCCKYEKGDLVISRNRTEL